MKNLIYALLAVFTLVSCSKEKDPGPAAVEGRWSLSSLQTKIQVLGSDPTDETASFPAGAAYIDLKENNKLASNIIMGDITDDSGTLLTVGTQYESDYEIKGNTITLQLYDADYEAYVPVKLNIKNQTDSQLVLQITKAELVETAKAYDELEGSPIHSQMLVFVTSLEATLTFAK